MRGAAEFLDAGLAELERVDPAAQLLDVDRLGEGRADHLAADEIDAEVEPAYADQRQAGDGQRGSTAPARGCASA